MKLQLRTLCLLVVGLLIFGCGTGDSDKLLIDKFRDDIELGMSVSEVRKIMGEPDKISTWTSIGGGGGTQLTFSWNELSQNRQDELSWESTNESLKILKRPYREYGEGCVWIWHLEVKIVDGVVSDIEYRDLDCIVDGKPSTRIYP